MLFALAPRMTRRWIKIVCQTLTSIGLNLRATAFIELDEWGCQTLEMHVYSNRPRAAVSLSWGPADAAARDDAGAVRSLFPLRRSNGQYLGLGSFLDAFSAACTYFCFPKTPHRFANANFDGAEAKVGMRDYIITQLI